MQQTIVIGSYLAAGNICTKRNYKKKVKDNGMNFSRTNGFSHMIPRGACIYK